MKNAFNIFRREFKSYFDSPVAYVFLSAFLALSGFLTWVVAAFYERRSADLEPFFFWHPWIYLLLVPAATMGLWADERRGGTAELLLTLPVTPLEALAGKFAAAWAFMALALALTFPVAASAAYLGSPDWGAIACAYLGSLLLAGAASAIGLFASTLSRSATVGFVAALAMVFLLLIIGFTPVVSTLASWGAPAALVDGVASLSLLSHYESMLRGVLDLADVVYYAGAMAFFVWAARMSVDGRRGAGGGAAWLAAIAAATVAACAVSSRLHARADLTEERLYTLTDGSRAVVSKLDKDVTLKYFFSASSPDMPMELKTYSKEVRNLLDEYIRAAGGRLALEEYDPEPDSDAEEWAQKFGIEPQTANPFGAGVYFGIAAVCGDETQAIGALSPRMKSSLEYDITRLVTRVAWPEKPVVGVMASIPGATRWTALAELAKDYAVRDIAPDAGKIDADVKTLVVVHPKGLDDKALYAIDQFVLGGGRLVAFTDPMNLKEIMSSQRGQMGMPQESPSSLGKLYEAWGIAFDTSKVTCDLASATAMNDGRGGYMEEPGVLSLDRDNFATDDILVTGLGRLTMPFAGEFVFTQTNAPGLKFTPVIHTSADKSASSDKMGLMMGIAQTRQAVPDGRARVVAARLDGTFKTAFPNGPDGTNAVAGALAQGEGSVILFADADFLADDFCVRMMRTPFGNVAQPLNDNLALFFNTIEQFAGRPELAGIRTRGVSDRPFDVVDALETAAMEKGRQKEEEFQAELQSTQQRINALREAQGGDKTLVTREQQEELRKLNRKLADARRDLKNLRKELTRDIVSLGTLLKWINIALMPLLVVLAGLVRALAFKRG